MSETKRYEFEGIVLDIPIYYDEQAEMYIEHYPDFIENPIWTPNGHRVLFSGTDACRHAEEATPGGCPDCGSCIHYRRASDHTWVGVCRHEKNRRQIPLMQEDA